MVAHSIYLTSSECLFQDFLMWYKISSGSGLCEMSGCISFYYVLQEVKPSDAGGPGLPYCLW